MKEKKLFRVTARKGGTRGQERVFILTKIDATAGRQNSLGGSRKGLGGNLVVLLMNMLLNNFSWESILKERCFGNSRILKY